MDKKIYFGVLIVFLVISCKELTIKRYENYNEDDFIEVQGIVTKTVGRKTLQNTARNDIYFVYNLNKERPDVGFELKSPYVLNNGGPVIVLVHKKDSDVSSFGARGILNEDVLLSYLEKCEEMGGGYFGVDKQYID